MPKDQTQSLQDFIFSPDAQSQNMSGWHRFILGSVLGVTSVEKITPEQHPILWEAIEEARIKAGQAPIASYIYKEPNGYANAAAVAGLPGIPKIMVFSEMLPILLNKEEMTDIIGHELGHSKNTLISLPLSLLSVIGADYAFKKLSHPIVKKLESSNAPDIAKNAGFLARTVAGVAVFCATMAGTNRLREYIADDYGSTMSGNNDNMIRALLKLENHNAAIQQQIEGVSEPNALDNVVEWLNAPFRSHPTTEKRAKALGVDVKKIKEELQLTDLSVDNAQNQTLTSLIDQPTDNIINTATSEGLVDNSQQLLIAHMQQ